MLRKNYSTMSLDEIREEMRALYSEEQIDEILSFFTGYKAYFKYDDLIKRIQSLFCNSILAKDLQTVLNDLYTISTLHLR